MSLSKWVLKLIKLSKICTFQWKFHQNQSTGKKKNIQTYAKVNYILKKVALKFKHTKLKSKWSDRLPC
jgi:hypothetical protein